MAHCNKTRNYGKNLLYSKLLNICGNNKWKRELATTQFSDLYLCTISVSTDSYYIKFQHNLRI